MAEKKGAGGEKQTYDPKTGRYGSGGKATGEYDNLPSANRIVGRYEKSHGEIKYSGAISGAQGGALNSDNPEDEQRTRRHAEITYERIRRAKDDVDKIAHITGYSQTEIQQVKQHMFVNEYDLADGKHRFDPDFDQAQSWDRLQSGNPLPHDLVMIEHELIESALMAKGMSYDEAHTKANETANYQQALKEYKNATAKKKRN